MNIWKFGFYSSILLVVTTLVTFAFAITAIPVSGPFCTENCIGYPYLHTLGQYPKDYIWMFICSVQLIIYLTFIISIHYTASKENKIFSAIGAALSMLSAGILLVSYKYK
jgi:hypothetical protein